MKSFIEWWRSSQESLKYTYELHRCWKSGLKPIKCTLFLYKDKNIHPNGNRDDKNLFIILIGKTLCKFFVNFFFKCLKFWKILYLICRKSKIQKKILYLQVKCTNFSLSKILPKKWKKSHNFKSRAPIFLCLKFFISLKLLWQNIDILYNFNCH